MPDNIYVDPGSGGGKVLVATRTLTVNATAGVEVPYGILGYESGGELVAIDESSGLPVSVLSVAALPLPGGAATETTLGTLVTTTDFDAKIGNLTETAPADDTASSGLNGRLQRIAQRITSLLALIPSALTGLGNFRVAVAESSVSQAVTGTFWQATQPVSAASLPLPTGAATDTLQGTGNASLASIDAKITACNTGAVTISAALPAGTNVIGHVIVDTAPTTTVTGTVTANAGSGTFAVSAASLPLPTGAATESTLSTLNGKVTACNTGAVVVSTLPATPAGTNTIGYVNAIQAGDTIEIAGTTYTVLRAFANATASGETTVVAAVSSKKLRVLAYSIGPVSAAVNVYFDNATNGAITSTKYLAANGGMGRGLNHFGHFQTGTNNEALRINLSATANVGVDVLYIEV